MIADFNMLVTTGLAIAEAVRGEAPRLPVIVISGWVTDELQSAAGEHGVLEAFPNEDMLELPVGAVPRARARGR